MDKSEQHKAYLEKNVSQRTEISFVSKLIKKGGETYTPSSCFIKGKESISDRTFQVIFGGRTLDIPYSKVKHLWKIESGEIKIELDSTIILDEGAITGKQFTFESL